MIEQLLRLLAVNTCQLWRITPITPNLVKIHEYMECPHPGDWVLEISSLAYVLNPSSHNYSEHKDIKNCIGRLIIKDHEEVVKHDDGEYKDKFTYIENMHGELFKWNNCRFIRILDSPLGLYGFDESAIKILDSTLGLYGFDESAGMLKEKQEWLSQVKIRYKDDLIAIKY